MGNLAASSESVHPSDLLQKVEADGFAIVLSFLDDETVEQLGTHLSNSSYGMRNLLAVPLFRELAASASVRILAETVIGKNCYRPGMARAKKEPPADPATKKCPECRS